MRLWGKKAEGLISFYRLSDWWLSAFTEQERQHIQEQYKPLGLASSSLTQGKVASSQPVTDFLNVLAMGKDKSIAERIRRKMDELAQKAPLEEPGCYQGRHFTTYVEDVKALKRDGKLEEAEALLTELVKATEAEDQRDHQGVAPWYYEELAELYRKRKDYAAEVKILERFAEQRHAPGITPPRLQERLEKAKALIETEKGK